MNLHNKKKFYTLKNQNYLITSRNKNLLKINFFVKFFFFTIQENIVNINFKKSSIIFQSIILWNFSTFSF